jgi:hypothetical protein
MLFKPSTAGWQHHRMVCASGCRRVCVRPGCAEAGAVAGADWLLARTLAGYRGCVWPRRGYPDMPLLHMPAISASLCEGKCSDPPPCCRPYGHMLEARTGTTHAGWRPPPRPRAHLEYIAGCDIPAVILLAILLPRAEHGPTPLPIHAVPRGTPQVEQCLRCLRPQEVLTGRRLHDGRGRHSGRRRGGRRRRRAGGRRAGGWRARGWRAGRWAG